MRCGKPFQPEIFFKGWWRDSFRSTNNTPFAFWLAVQRLVGMVTAENQTKSCTWSDRSRTLQSYIIFSSAKCTRFARVEVPSEGFFFDPIFAARKRTLPIPRNFFLEKLKIHLSKWVGTQRFPKSRIEQNPFGWVCQNVRRKNGTRTTLRAIISRLIVAFFRRLWSGERPKLVSPSKGASFSGRMPQPMRSRIIFVSLAIFQLQNGDSQRRL
jgi:hypothetical protein